MILIGEDRIGSIDLARHHTLRIFPLRRVRGCLFLEDCLLLRSLQSILEVGEDLDLDWCPSLTRLPTTLRVGGSLWVRHTNISELPDDLEVGSNLWVQDSKVTHVPESARIYWDVIGLGET